jgi:hypothetical protein
MVAARIYGWPVIVGLKILGALIAERLAQPSFRQRTYIRGTYRWIAFRKALRLSNQSAEVTFTAPRATAQRNHEICKAASVGGLSFIFFIFPVGAPFRIAPCQGNLAVSLGTRTISGQQTLTTPRHRTSDASQPLRPPVGR